MVEKKEQKPKDGDREPRDLRYRRQFFPDAERLVFSTERRGFVPLPIILRKLMRHLTPPELRVLIYLQLRASRYFICYPTLEEISYELDVNRKNLTPHLKSLEEKRFISTHTAAGKKYFLIHDPRIAIEHLAAEGKLKDEEIEGGSTMSNTVRVNPSGRTVTIVNLVVSNSDFFSILATQPESKREQSVADVIAVGSAAMRRVQTSIDVDFVEKRFLSLYSKFENSLGVFERQAADALTKRFSPTESGSYTKQIGDLVASARKDVQAWTAELGKVAKELLDPDKKGSAVGRLEQLVDLATKQFERMFDPDVKGSYAARLSDQLEKVFGGNGRAGALQAALTLALDPVLKELRELKEKFEARKAAEQVVASTPLKGQPFEELVQSRLAQLAQPFGDDVAWVASGNGGSRAGDFLVTVNGSGKRVVVEARDRKQLSLPAIKGELDRQIREREADFALYVSSAPQMLPQHVGDLQVYEDKLVTTLHNLHIGYRLARLLVTFEATDGEFDIGGLRAILGKIKDTARSLRDVKSKATQVRKLADGIHTDADETERQIMDLLNEAEGLLNGPEVN